MGKPLPTKVFSDHHAPASTPLYVSLFSLGLIAIVAFAVWGFMFALLPMD
jgi:hypothetical protein